MKKKHKEATTTEGASTPSYEVGYGKPPKHSQFRSGRSGNPKGRPKGQQNLKTILRQTLSEKVIVREGDRTQRISKLDAFVRRTVNGGLQGDARQFQNLLLLIRVVGFLDEEERADVPLTAEDDAIIADFFERIDREPVNEVAATDPSDRASPALEKSEDKK